MSLYEPEPTLLPRRPRTSNAEPRRPRLLLKFLTIAGSILLILGITGFFAARSYVHHLLTTQLPQIDGTLTVPGLSAPVAVQRDAHGVPHIRAASLDDLVFAQGFVTAQDRLFQMDLLRRHAAGELAEVIGPSLLEHDRIQRTLQLRATADRAVSTLPAAQLRYVEIYARGVNASIALQRSNLPLEFRVLRYTPAPWTPRDTILVGLVMFQDLTNSFPTKLSREAIAARLPADLLADLYPVGSWRDHPPAQPIVDLTAPQELPDVPLDESQTKLTEPGAPRPDSGTWESSATKSTASPADILALQHALGPVCESCTAGSNNWVVAGSRTATGKPLLSNDMHLSHRVPGIWYQVDLAAPGLSGPFHAAGVSLPGIPFLIVGHNDHIAWGFTNLGADVQDLYIEHLRGSGSTAEYQTPDRAWHPVLHQTEVIHIHGKPDVTLDVQSTLHGGIPTPIISPVLPTEKRALALRWTIYDSTTLSAPLLNVASASDWTSFLAAFSHFGGPAQNVVYADDQGHIGYHAFGQIPIRTYGAFTTPPPPPPTPEPTTSAPPPTQPTTPSPTQQPPTPISPVPVDAVASHYDWTGYIPFDQLPQALDPPNGILATANSRVTPEGYPYTITDDWAAPYRNERIWKVLTSNNHFSAADLLSLQTDVYSDLDRVIAQRLAYAIDHSTTASQKDKRLHQAADLLRNWNGVVDANSPAPPIVLAAREALWQLLLEPRLGSELHSNTEGKPTPLWKLYSWGERSYAAEQLIMHTPDRWLPPGFANWDDLLAAAVSRGLTAANAPSDLSHWSHGQTYPVEIEHPIYSHSRILRALIGLPIGTGVQPQSGDTSTVKQVGRTFGPSERFTADLSDLDGSTLNLVLGQSGNPASPWFLDQWPAWYNGTTFPMPFSTAAVNAATTHTLTLTPQ
ncbi:penicillin acylase family protein [Edaphobacter aggregans]|uniref:penicillin acylase family protein n=1 Tax=Edaphobacter aggregans TaxID=570835 RepID=UPI00054E27A8|nr:penicillin acylase family protein [Edaphobacter aggregans]